MSRGQRAVLKSVGTELTSDTYELFEDVELILELLAEAEELLNDGFPDQAMEICDDIVIEFGSSDSPRVIEAVAEALLCKGHALGSLQQVETEFRAYDEIVTRFELNPDPDVKFQVARARFNKAVCLADLSRWDSTIAAYTSFVRRYESTDNPDIKDHVARALRNAAFVLKLHGQLDEAMETFDDLLSRFGETQSPDIRATIAEALTSRAGLELESGNLDSAIESTSQALASKDVLSADGRILCYWVRACAHLLRKQKSKCCADISEALELVPVAADPLQVPRNTNLLEVVAEAIGRERVVQLIRESASARLLAGLLDQLERELAQKTTALREIEEVARDMLRDLAKSGGSTH